MPYNFSTGRSAAWAARFKEAIDKKRTEAKEKRGLRKKKAETRREHGKQRRDAIKKIRKEDKPGRERAMKIRATRAYHKVDKEGKPGGMKGVAKYSKGVREKEARKKAQKERRDA